MTVTIDDDAGRVRVQTQDGPVTFAGTQLGRGSSHRAGHLHPPKQYPRPGKDSRCNGCRWRDVSIYWNDEDTCYVVVNAAMSVVPGEHERWFAVWTADPEEVISTLTLEDKEGDFMPQAAQRALEDALSRYPHNPRARALHDAFRRWDDE